MHINRLGGIWKAMNVADRLGCSFVMVGNGKFSLVDNGDFESVSRLRWRIHTGGYAIASHKNRRTKIYMHRFILHQLGKLVTDHINRNKLDNRRGNIRACDQTLNHANRVGKIGRSIKYKGVKREGNRWAARLINRRKEYYLGILQTDIEAARAYDAFAIKTWGEFARPNFTV